MMQIKYTEDGEELIRLEVEVSDRAVYHKELQVEEYVLLTFNTDKLIPFRKGDYIDTEFGRFYIVHLEKPSRNVDGDGGWSYEQKFHAPWEQWTTRMMFYSRQSGSEKAWSMTQRPEYFMQIVVDNLKAAGFGDFLFDIDPELSDMKLIQFDGDNIVSGLTKIAEAWETEWWPTDNIIHLRKCETGTPVRFKEGELIRKMSRSEGQDNDYITRLYAFGSTRNIPVNYRKDEDSDAVIDGVVERRLKLPKGTPYIDAWPGMDEHEIVEGVAVFDEIYPRRTGKMTDISTVEYRDEVTDDDHPDGELVPWNAYRFRDNGIVFKSEYCLPDTELRITFQSGALSGMDFAVIFNPDECTDESSPEAQLWEIVRNNDYGTDLPNDNSHPAEGDEYILYGYDTKLVSDLLIPDAEHELLTETKKLLAKKCVDTGVYSCETDPIKCAGYTENNLGELTHKPSDEIDLEVGQLVELVADNYFAETGGCRISRVRSFDKRLDNKYRCTYEVGETASYSRNKEIDEKMAALTMQSTQSITIGSSVYLIKRYDDTAPSDFNAYSALRAMKEFISKTRPDTAEKLIKFLEGWEVGEWEPDAAGAKAWIDANGDANIEADILRVRKKAFFKSLVVAETEYIGGELAITPGGGIECTDVVAVDDGWRCLYMCKDTDGKRIHCKFKAGDFAKCQTFNLGTPEPDGSYSDVANTYYWREVVAVGNPSNPDDVTTDEQGREYCYIVLSNEPGHYDPASVSEPHAGDHIVHLGNADDPLRQTAIIISTTATTAPSIVMYTGINTFALANRAIITLGRDEQGNAWLRLGAKGAKHYLNYNQATGLDVCGNLHVSSGESVEELLGDKEGNYRLELNPAAMAVQCDAEGNITADIKDMPVLTMQAYLGNAEIGKYNATTKKGVSYHLEATAGVEFYNDYTIPDNQVRMRRESGMSADTALVTVTAKIYNGGDEPAMVLTNRATVYKVRPGVGGAPGDPGLRLVLSQSAMAVPCDAAGTPLAGSLPIEITAALYRGNDAVAPSALKLSNIEGFGTDGISVDGTTIRISNTLDRVNKATISATYGEYSAQTTLSVTKVLNGKPGDAGQAAVVYTIEPTAAIIKRGALGLADPARVGVHVYRTTGNSPRQELADWSNEGLEVSYTQVKSKEDDNSPVGYLSYGQSVTVAKDDKELIFGLYQDTALLAEVRVPVVEDMTDYEVGGVNLIHNTNQGARGWDRSTYSYYRNANGSTVGWNNADLFVLTTDGKDVVATNGYKYPYKSKLDDNKQTHTTEPEEVTYQLKFATGLSEFEGKYYTLSLDVPLRYKCAVKDAMELRIGFGADFASVKTYHSETLPVQATLGDATIHVSATFKPDALASAANLFIYLVIKNPAAVAGDEAQSILDYIRVRNVMLERGTVATLWTPAPTDIDYLTTALAEATDITGGVVMTTRVRVGCTVNGKWTEYGGLNGAVTDVSGKYVSDSPIVYAGGEMIDAAKQPTNTARATSMIRVDGTAYFANNTVRMSENEMEVGDFILLRDDGLHMVDPATQSERLWITNGSVGDLANLGSLVGVSNKTAISGTATMNVHISTGNSQSGGLAYEQGTYLQSLNSIIALNLNSSNAIADSGALKVAVGLSFTPTGHSYGSRLWVHLAARLMCYDDSRGTWAQVGTAQTFSIQEYANTSVKTHTFNFAAAVTKGRKYRIEIFCPQNDAPGAVTSRQWTLTATIAAGAQTITPTQQRTILGKDGLATAWGKTALLVKEDEVTLVDGFATLKVAGSEIHADINNGDDELFVRLAPDGIWIRSNRLDPGNIRLLNFKNMLSAGLFEW